MATALTMCPTPSGSDSKMDLNEDENVNPTSTRHKKAMTLDYMSQKERQARGESSKKCVKFNERPSPSDNSRNLVGHVNALFCCDEVDGDLPQLLVEYRRQIGGRGKRLDQMEDATDLKFTVQNSLLVTDLVNSRLLMFNEFGEVTSIQAEEIIEPWASAVTPDGRIAVTSRRNKKVVILGGDGTISGRFGADYLFCPTGIAVTDEGYFIVTDFEISHVLIFDPTGTFVKKLGGGEVTFYQPRYVTVSCFGDVIISDSGNHRLVVFDRNWNFVRTIGFFGKQDGCFKFPHATCTDNMGNILVCDRYNDRVSAFTRRGEFLRHIVTSAHKLRHPQALALSPNMELYVSHGVLKAHSVMVLHIKVRTHSVQSGPATRV